jgi:hypothetical protein
MDHTIPVNVLYPTVGGFEATRVSFAVQKAFPFIAFFLTRNFINLSSCATAYVYFEHAAVSRKYPNLIKILLLIICIK